MNFNAENAAHNQQFPSYLDVQNIFSETILKTNVEREYLDFDNLIEKWNEYAKSNAKLDTLEKLREISKFASMYSIDTKSPYFISKLYSGSDSLSLLADMIISYYNTNVHVYSVSPVFTMAEHLTVDRISKLIDPNGYGNGIFLPGGSYCNLVGLISARHYYDSDIKSSGMTSSLKIITSKKSHYSIDKAVIMMGIGLDNVIKIDLDNIPLKQFEKVLDKNNVFCVCTTFGTTSEGILESIERFRPLLEKRRIWHHVDACVGGVLVYSDRHIEHTATLKKADSIGIDFHKIANITVQCSALMIRKQRTHILKEVTNVDAHYLFHEDDNNRDVDVSANSFQCGRTADAFRLFLIDSVISLNIRVESFLERVMEFKTIIKSDARFELHDAESNVTHVLFVPKTLMGMNNLEIHKILGKVIRVLRTENIFLEYHDIYVRLVPINPELTELEFTHILNRIDYHLYLMI